MYNEKLAWSEEWNRGQGARALFKWKTKSEKWKMGAMRF